jgi:hypothetical protein
MKLGLLLALFSISAAAAQDRTTRVEEWIKIHAGWQKCTDEYAWEEARADKVSDAATLGRLVVRDCQLISPMPDDNVQRWIDEAAQRISDERAQQRSEQRR